MLADRQETVNGIDLTVNKIYVSPSLSQTSEIRENERSCIA